MQDKIHLRTVDHCRAQTMLFLGDVTDIDRNSIPTPRWDYTALLKQYAILLSNSKHGVSGHENSAHTTEETPSVK